MLMRLPLRVPGVAVVVGLVIAASGCRGQAPRPSEGIYVPTATVRDLMLSIVDPSADVVWDAVRTVVGADGTENHAPRTDQEWADVRQGAIRLVEAANLLMVPGRQVARPDEHSEAPGVELEPAEMEALVNADRQAWVERVQSLRNLGLAVLQAIDAKDAGRLFETGGELDTACENCHRQYWYPNEQLPVLPAVPTSTRRP
jgi:hypothetical protein